MNLAKSRKAFGGFIAVMVFSVEQPTFAQFQFPNPFEAKSAIGILVNPVGAAIQTGAQAIGVDKSVSAATQAVIAPVSLSDSNVRNNLPGEAAAVANKAAGAAEAVSRAAIKIAIVPYEVQSEGGRKALAGGNPEEVWNTAKGKLQDAGVSATSATLGVVDTAASLNEAVAQKTEEIAAKVFGDAGRQFVRSSLVEVRLANALSLSAATYLDLISRGEDPAMLLSIPLAAALRQAYEMHKGSAKPLPDGIKSRLRNIYSQETLDRARWTVGQVELSLPNGINRLNQVFGGEYAVTINDLIVFSIAPSDGDGYIRWWAHEVRHTEQYRELGGIDSFAWAYIRYGNDLESDARSRESKVGPANQPALFDGILAAATNKDKATPPTLRGQCRKNGIEQSIHIEQWNGSPLPCSVNSVVNDKGRLTSEMVVFSRYDYRLCVREASVLIERLVGNDWSCSLLE